MLHSSPSFSIYADDQNQQKLAGMEGFASIEDFQKSVTIGENGEAPGNGSEFSFPRRDMELIQEEEMEEEDGLNSTGKRSVVGDDDEIDLRPASPPMYLAAGLGIDASVLGGGYDPIDLLEEEMMDGPHPSLLRNYVQSLWSEGKLHEAEEHSYRATQENPEDGETLLQYAQLVWELHHDQGKAFSYFDRAAKAAPNDSHILAAHAKFLWELEHDEEDEIMNPEEEDGRKLESSSPEERIEPADSPPKHVAPMDVPDLQAAGLSESDMLKYYQKMIEENPTNHLLLKNYARLLLQSKVDVQEAEEFYKHAIEADPGDGETLSEYAKLVWDRHQDYSKASNYFERAVHASPTNSVILGAYASFLWETDELEDEDWTAKNSSQPPLDTESISVGNV